jgi:xanthine/CO dehydrogenase XdhC/CoxF family maturation factor
MLSHPVRSSIVQSLGESRLLRQDMKTFDDGMCMTILEKAESWLGQGRKLALATVVETWGSAPQPVGSQLLVDAEGHFEGAVSGGCVEGEVITQAQDVILSGGHRLLEFGVADETAWRAGLACGGRIKIYVEALT